MTNLNKRIQHRLYILFSIIILSSGCTSIFKQLKEVGNPPKINDVNVYDKEGLEALTSKKEQHSNIRTSNSLWTPNSKTFFFRERKAKEVGDILKVKIVIQDEAKLDNKTTKSRSSGTNLGIKNLFGLEKQVARKNKDVDPSRLIDLGSTSKGSGDGKIDRKETIKTTIAATIIRVLPSGNLLIKGSQEIRVNFELREITIAGIVRPEDIGSDNSVELGQVAEARVSYGGRGHITQYQQSPYGKQVLDIISPF